MQGNKQSARDRGDPTLAVGLVLLAVLGIATIFHEPIRALVSPGSSGSIDSER